MTAPNGPIVFNSSSGSDSLASGLGPSTAVNSTTEGTTASFSGGTITFSGATDLSGVSAGDIIYIVTSTGRRFSVIATVNDAGDSLTTDDTDWAGTTSGLSWAIGGKRATLDATSSRFIGADFDDGWEISLEDDQSISSAWQLTSPKAGVAWTTGLTIKSSASGTERVITQTANDYILYLNVSYCALTIYDLKLQNSNGTKTSAFGITANKSQCYLNLAARCTFGDATNTLAQGIAKQITGALRVRTISRCTFDSCSTAGIYQLIDPGHVLFCKFVACDVGIYGLNSGISVHYSTFDSNTSYDVRIHNGGGSGEIHLHNNTFYNSGSHSIYQDVSGGITMFSCVINVFSNAGGYAIYLQSVDGSYSNWNAFYNPTSGEMNGLANGDDDITLSADPFVDAANGDFNINSNAGGGALLRAATLAL